MKGEMDNNFIKYLFGILTINDKSDFLYVEVNFYIFVP